MREGGACVLREEGNRKCVLSEHCVSWNREQKQCRWVYATGGQEKRLSLEVHSRRAGHGVSEFNRGERSMSTVTRACSWRM